MRVIVCGGRDEDLYDDAVMRALIRGLGYHLGPRLTIIHGAARGADVQIGGFASGIGLKVEEFPAGWEKHGRAAGFIRNQAMLESGADLVIAFKDNFNWKLDRGGTEDMVRRAKAAGVPTYVVQRA